MNTQSVRESGQNLDDYTTNGIYHFDSGHAPSNPPVGSNGWLIVMQAGADSIIKQIWYRQGTINSNDFQTYVRGRHADTGWSDWQRYMVEKDLFPSWTDLTLNSGFTAASNNYGGRNKLGYCKIGDIVYLAGGVGITDFSTNAVVAVLPSGYRPATNHYYIAAVTSSSVCRTFITPSGDIRVEWIKSIVDGSDINGKVSWIDLSTWFLAV